MDGATTFDPVLVDMTAVGSGAVSDSYSGDDDFECAYPPTEFSCPEATYGVGQYEIVVFAGSLDDQCADADLAEYRITVDGDATLVPGMWDDARL